MPGKPGRWTPAQATTNINACAKRDDLDIDLTDHAVEQMDIRDLLTGDLLHLLRTGFVYEDPEPATRDHFKYAIEGKTPNSDGRSVRAIVIPSGGCGIKIVTVMWRDER